MNNPHPLLPVRTVAPPLMAAFVLLSTAVAHAQPMLNTISPDGTVQFQPTNQLALTIQSSAGLTPANISLQLTEMKLDRTTTSQTLTTANGLTVGGTANMRTVSTAVTSNKVYTAILTVTDGTGTASYTNTFDTIIPIYTWEAEDWDYDSGKFIDNPQTNAYAGLAGVAGVDCNNPNAGGTSYRPTDTGNLGTENCGDIPREIYTSSGLTDYDVGWSNGGSDLWANYTRHYPAGKWNIFFRASGWAASTDSAELFQGGPNGTLLGRFVVPNTSTADNTYQIYTWVPLVDVAGNLVEFDTDGTPQTLTLKTVQGNWNANFFMLMPVDPNYKPVPFISNVKPDATKQMFATNNTVTFDVNSVPGITPDNVEVTVNGIKPYGLSLSGAGHVLHGSFPVATNVAYNVAFKLTDANGTSSFSSAFSTYAASNFQWECEDYDYDGGKFFNNPQTNSYAQLSGIEGIDAQNNQSGGTSYRGTDAGNIPNEVNGDVKRAQYANASDYDIGWTAAGVWANYTRAYPKGDFNVLFRAAGNAGGTDVARLLRVTSGVGTPSFTTEPLGQFNVPNTGSWQTFTWTPLVDASGNPVTVSITGSVSTFQLAENAGGWNGNFFMLAPPDTVRPKISQIFPNNQAMYQPTNSFSFLVNSSIPIDPNLVTVTLNGSAVSNLAFSGPSTNLTVSTTLQPQTAYWGSIAVNTTNNDPYFVNVGFNTLSETNYTVEAEDFDYGAGQFIDNPAINAYSGLSGVEGIDAHNATSGGTAYRSSPDGDLANEINGDFQRPRYVAAGASDYNIGWTAAGQWANYTRTYPAGTFNVLLRAASPGSQTDAATLMRVTGGVGTANQTTEPLGKFNVPATGSYQTYTFVPLVDSANNLVTVTNSGKVQTFRLSEDNGNWNANFFMFVPAQAPAANPKLAIAQSAGKVTISWTPGGGALYSSPALGANANWQPVTGAANPATIPIGSGTMFYRVK